MFISALFFADTLKAQDEPTTVSSEKVAPNLTFTFNNANDSSRDVTARLTKKEGKKWLPVPNVEILFFLNSTDELGLIGKVKTNDKGMAVLLLSKNEKFLIAKNIGAAYIFTAQLRNLKEFEDADAEITIKESKLTMDLTADADVKTATATFFERNDKNEFVPLKDAQIRFYVKRTYSLFPLSEGNIATDDAGVATLEVPAGIAGDEKGNLTIIARLEENETFGSVTNTQVKNWGVPVQIDEAEQSRTLWGSRANAPLVLVIGVNCILIGIWGVIGYIIYLLFEVNYLGTHIGHHHKQNKN